MDQADRPSAFACEDKWVVFTLFGAPAKAAVNLFSLTKTVTFNFRYLKSCAVFTVWASLSSQAYNSLGVKFICSHRKSLTLKRTRPNLMVSNFLILQSNFPSGFLRLLTTSQSRSIDSSSSVLSPWSTQNPSKNYKPNYLRESRQIWAIVLNSSLLNPGKSSMRCVGAINSIQFTCLTILPVYFVLQFFLLMFRDS